MNQKYKKRHQLKTGLMVSLVIGAMAISCTAIAKNNNNNGNGNGNGNQPNGKPFQFLQNQIDILAMDIENLDQSINFRIDELATEVSDLAQVVNQNSSDIEALEAYQLVQDQLIETLHVGLFLVEQKVTQNEDDIAALESYNELQDGLLAALNDKLMMLESKVEANENDISAIMLADATMQAQIASLQSAITFLNQQNTTQNSRITSLTSQLNSVQVTLANKQNRINRICPVGSSIRVVFNNGSVACEVDDASNPQFLQFTSAERQLVRTKFCASSVPVIGCVDFEYYSSGTAFCPSSYGRSGGGFSYGRTTDVLPTVSGPSGNGWYNLTKNGDDETFSNFGYVSCVRLRTP